MGKTTQLISTLLLYGILIGSPSSRVSAETTTPSSGDTTLSCDPTTLSSESPTSTTTAKTPVEKCNEYGFLCTDNGGYKLCVDNNPPGSEVKCKRDTKCHKNCPIECTSRPCEKCNKAGYYCVDDTSFKMCLDDRETAEDQIDKCTGTSVCSMNCNSASVCSAQGCPVTCTEDTRLPVEGEPSSYYICTVDKLGQVTVDKYDCPDGTVFNEVLKKCWITPTPTTPPAAFECRSAGKFPDPQSCHAYYVCIASGNENQYTKSNYTCPSRSYFNPSNDRCTLDQSVCTSVKVTRERANNECSETERMEDPSSCSHYMLCHWFRGRLTPHRYECPDDSVFNPYTGRCTQNYDCNSGE